MSQISRRSLLKTGGIAALAGAGAVTFGLPSRSYADPKRKADAASDIARYAALTLTPASQPSASSGVDRAAILLTDGNPDTAVSYAFAAASSVDLTATFSTVADISEVRLAGSGITSASVSFTALDGIIDKVTTDASGDVLIARPPTTRPFTAVTVHAETAGHLSFADLMIPGTAHGLISLAVTDPSATANTPHVHSAGEAFTVSVLPLLTAFGNITGEADLSIRPGATPYATENTDKIGELLTDGKTSYAPGVGVMYDFWAVDTDKRYVDVRADFAEPCAVESIMLTQFSSNSEYGILKASVSFLDSDDTVIDTVDSVLVTEGITITATATLDQPVVASAVVIRAFCRYKINLTELAINGLVGDSRPTVPVPDLRAAWYDHTGARLTADVPLSVGRSTDIASPPSPAVGYYGLRFSASDQVVIADRIPGEPREYGFAVLDPAPARHLDEASSFGMVHATITDPYLVGWIKTLEWLSPTFDATKWRQSITDRENAGLVELPLVAGGDWPSINMDADPIQQSQLDTIRRGLADHLRTTPEVTHWELGIEENLGNNFHQAKYYWPNLDKKVTAARAAADDAGVDPNYIFQIAEPDSRRPDIPLWLSSDAAPKFDILALHPYAWPDFQPPESWMEDLMSYVYQQMDDTGRSFPVWVTEVGAPEALNYEGGWFGYGDPNSDDRSPVTGVSREQQLHYLIKVNVLGLQTGIEKIIWYNYVDRNVGRTYPENGFGISDYWGYAKPAYPGWVTAAQLLDHRTAAGVSQINNVFLATFAGQTDDVLVVWRHPDGSQSVPWSELGLQRSQVKRVTNAVGRSVAIAADRLTLTGEPTYLTVNRSTDLAAGKPLLDGVVDLGSVRRVQTVRVTWATSSRHQYKVELSADGTTFRTVGKQRQSAYPLSMSIDQVGQSARYIRIVSDDAVDGISAF